jgi:hypothetical protein
VSVVKDRHLFFTIESRCRGDGKLADRYDRATRAYGCPRPVTIVHVAIFPDYGPKAVWYCEEHGRHAAAHYEEQNA